MSANDAGRTQAKAHRDCAPELFHQTQPNAMEIGRISTQISITTAWRWACKLLIGESISSATIQRQLCARVKMNHLGTQRREDVNNIWA